METFVVAFTTVLPLFLLILAGGIFSRTKVNHKNWIEVLNNYALWIGFPALVVSSLMHLNLNGQSYLNLILVNSGYILFCMLLVIPLSSIFRFSRQMQRALVLILPFGNIAYLGMPILGNAFGESILPVAAIISAVYVFWLLSVAIVILEISGEGRVNAKIIGLRLLRNPLLISVFIGMAIVIFRIEIPVFINDTIRLFADSVTAVVLFSLGIFLGIQKVGRLKDWLQVSGWALVTMIVIPFLFLQISPLFNLNELQLKATLIDSAMPLGITPYALAVQYKTNSTLVARIVVLGTLISTLIIPFWIHVIM
jgi:predicted permease